MNDMERALAEQACMKLVNRFANLNDAMRYEELAGLFVEDGSFARPTDPDNFTEGRAAILEAFQARPKEKITRHVISNIEVDITSESTAKSRCYAVLYTGSADKPAQKFGLEASASQFIGEFYDDFVKTDEGWKFKRRSGRIIFTTAG